MSMPRDGLRVLGDGPHTPIASSRCLEAADSAKARASGALRDVGDAIDQRDLELGAERIAQRARQGEAGKARAGDCDIEAGGLKRHVASGHLR